ncbi:hypothetical protein DA103_09135 [Enterobacter cloacae]|uniref:Uncharacterized protein n=1 Tax=Enterobacter cloacae TaxID=550 RepID=A0A2T4Y1A1_ENTCL|nr:hypothetical protein [Enterobacter cloacae]PTM35932.1 hypothetical protein DA103_09135 [Enterobacter cloacae]
MSNIDKQARLQHANELIRIIAAHGRRFFFSLHTGRTAEMLIDPRGRVWFVDEYTGKVIFTHKTTFANKWRGFSHGGTLRDLVEMMREYIVNGDPIPEYYLGPERRQLTDGNIWGYEPEAMQTVRDAAINLPIIKADRAASSPKGE